MHKEQDCRSQTSQSSGGHSKAELTSQYKQKTLEGIWGLLVCKLTYYRKFQTFTKLEKNSITHAHILTTLLQLSIQMA